MGFRLSQGGEGGTERAGKLAGKLEGLERTVYILFLTLDCGICSQIFARLIRQEGQYESAVGAHQEFPFL